MSKDEAGKLKDYIHDIQMSAEIDKLRSAVMIMSEATAMFIMDRYISPDRQAYVKAQVRGFIFEEINKRYPRWKANHE